MSALVARMDRGLNAEPEQQMLDLAHHPLRGQREAGALVNVTVAHPEDGEEPGQLLVLPRVRPQ